MATFTNIRASQAYAGDSVQVFLAQSDVSKLAAMTIGQLCTVGSSGLTGYVWFIDLYGTSFMVRPKYPFSAFQSDVVGYLKATETVTTT